MKAKKWLTVLLAGVMALSFTMFISASGESFVYVWTDPGTGRELWGGEFLSNYIGDSAKLEEYISGGYGEWREAAASSDGSYGEPASEQKRQEEADALAAEAMGIPQTVLFAAAEEGKSVGEYANNAVVNVGGLEDTTPVAQGGGVIINGEATNQTFTVAKALPAHVDYAKRQASAVEGRVLNVVNIKGSVSFETAQVNFYMPGVVAGQNIKVYQYVDGQWAEVSVAEIREDHVVVDMTKYGVLSFIEVSNADAAQ